MGYTIFTDDIAHQQIAYDHNQKDCQDRNNLCDENGLVKLPLIIGEQAF